MSRVIPSYLREIAGFIKANFPVKKVILFGSYAYGNPSSDSDIDLFVIMETEKRFAAVGADIKRAIRQAFGFYAPMDILVRTPSFVEERLQQNDFFIKDILEKGIPL